MVERRRREEKNKEEEKMGRIESWGPGGVLDGSGVLVPYVAAVRTPTKPPKFVSSLREKSTFRLVNGPIQDHIG